MLPYIKLLRPQSWIKNFFIFVPIFFAGEFFNSEKLHSVILAFIIFSLSASAVYIINDFADRELDRDHERKRFRPLASGLVSNTGALVLFVILLASISFLSINFVPGIIPLILIYLFFNIIYSFFAKKIVIIDLVIISFFYLLRILVGGEAGDVLVSSWLVLCTIFISLFLISGKRMAEFNQNQKRHVLSSYSGEFLKIILIIASTLSIISYGLYAVLSLQNNLAVYSILLVLLGIFRYLYIVFTTNESEYPEKVVIKDRVILLTVISWIIIMLIIFYGGNSLF